MGFWFWFWFFLFVCLFFSSCEVILSGFCYLLTLVVICLLYMESQWWFTDRDRDIKMLGEALHICLNSANSVHESGNSLQRVYLTCLFPVDGMPWLFAGFGDFCLLGIGPHPAVTFFLVLMSMEIWHTFKDSCIKPGMLPRCFCSSPFIGDIEGNCGTGTADTWYHQKTVEISRSFSWHVLEFLAFLPV